MTRWRPTSRLVACLLGALLVTGCTTLPESGPVRERDAAGSGLPQNAPYFKPPGPARDGSPASIVSGFLVAMQANPLSTSVARKFLSEQARRTWRPNQGTVVYDAFSVSPTSSGTRVRLADARRLDERGGWAGDAPGRTQTLGVELVSENGQWRIDNPVDALVVPTSFFDRSFSRFNLYFYDQTRRVLLPDPVFIPRGEQSATNLVRGLLAGPGSAIADVSRSALPSRTDLDLSVVVTEGGVAEVPLSREVLRATPEELSRAVDQLSWTLRQVPGIERVRITVGGVAVPLRGGRIDAPVSSGARFDAGGATRDPSVWGVRSGRVVDLGTTGDSSLAAVPGPLGRPGFAVRTLAVSEYPRQLAAVSQDGTTVYVADAEKGASGKVTRALSGGTDVLRPAYDMFDNLWLVDRTRQGARVLVVQDGRAREVRVPGVTGQDVSAFAVPRDGSRIAVAYAGTPAPPVRVTDLLRTDEGIVSGAGRSRTFAVGGSDGGRVADVGWRDPATLAVLTRPTAETSQVSFVAYDGSPASPTAPDASVFRGAAQAMVVSPDADLPLRLITPDQRLYTLSTNGNWPRTTSRIAAATDAR